MLHLQFDRGAGLAALADLRAEVSAGRPTPPRRITRAALEPALGPLGITRVADLTGLDRLGVPVWAATRPTSRGLSVSQGKALDHDNAWVSAVLESAEQALAEVAPAVVCHVESPTSLAARGLRAVTLERQSRCAARHLRQDRELAWVEGICLASGETVFAPYELVGMDMAAHSPWDAEHFQMTSLGLAASGNMAGAVLHGLRELLEDDAAFGLLDAGMLGATPSTEARGRVACPSDHPLTDLIDRLRQAGVASGFARVTSDVGEPVVVAALKPMQAGLQRRAYFGGRACRSNVPDAALAALLEAVQSRLTFVSGGRDDLWREDYRTPFSESSDALFRPACPGTTQAAQDEPTALADLLGKLRAAGIEGVYAFPLGGMPGVFEVVRLLADDLVSRDRVPGCPHDGRAARMILDRWRAA